MKTDDDTFVNMFSLMPHLHEVAATQNVAGKTSSAPSDSNMLLLCNVWRKDLVAREGKWRIRRSTWHYNYWPPFCQGLAFIMTVNFVASAYQLVHRVPRLWLDDVRHCNCFAYFVIIIHTCKITTKVVRLSGVAKATL